MRYAVTGFRILLTRGGCSRSSGRNLVPRGTATSNHRGVSCNVDQYAESKMIPSCSLRGERSPVELNVMAVGPV